MTDKLSQAILLLRQATDIQLEAHKLLAEWQEAYVVTTTHGDGKPISPSPPENDSGSIPPQRPGGDSFQGICDICHHRAPVRWYGGYYRCAPCEAKR